MPPRVLTSVASDLSAATLPPVPPLAERAFAHRGEMLAIARRLVPDRAAAEDLVQDALLAIVRYGHTHDPGRDLRPWLRTVLRNAARARQRRSGRAREVTWPGDVSTSHDQAADVEVADLAARVKAATWELAPANRTAFRLCYLDGLTHGEIARRMKRPVGSVQGLVYRARLALRRRLTGQDG